MRLIVEAENSGPGSMSDVDMVRGTIVPRRD